MEDLFEGIVSPIDFKQREERKCYKELTFLHPKYVVDTYSLHTYQVLISICVVTIAVIGYVNYRVIKIVKLKDPVLVGMLFCLKLSLLSFAIFYGFEASIT